MSRWARGEAVIEQLVARRELEAVTGAEADGIAVAGQLVDQLSFFAQPQRP